MRSSKFYLEAFNPKAKHEHVIASRAFTFPLKIFEEPMRSESVVHYNLRAWPPIRTQTLGQPCPPFRWSRQNDHGYVSKDTNIRTPLYLSQKQKPVAIKLSSISRKKRSSTSIPVFEGFTDGLKVYGQLRREF
ncbi:unnamed protein product [Angiostrongylus costaricensis]|uniref:Uncharacterized protein n=1 Tax=Angiostrongylus costaricensis TaxID=334426 RepID=A0A0R3PM48_ANGCS|nr:unnamed protein product [Angiostrongylus costaricensis]